MFKYSNQFIFAHLLTADCLLCPLKVLKCLQRDFVKDGRTKECLPKEPFSKEECNAPLPSIENATEA
uniref:Uncharacterized protein n=1 Tax=Globodera rostochiensis TaxID=31243 RepID=A0A914IA93_GLORO